MWDPGHRLNMSPAPAILTHFLILSCKCLLTDHPPGGTTGVMESSECPLGTEMSVIIPSSSSSLRSKLWSGFWSVLSLDIWLSWSYHTVSLASEPCCIGDSLGSAGAAGLAGAPVSICSSLSSSTTMSESCWVRLSLIIETLLALPPSTAGGGMSGSGMFSILDLPPGTEPSFCHSSSWTWSSHNIEEEWLLSMASLKAVCWDSVCGALGSSSTFSCKDWGGVGNFWLHRWDESQEDLFFKGWDPSLLILWLCCPLISHLGWDLLWDLPPCSIDLDSRSSQDQGRGLSDLLQPTWSVMLFSPLPPVLILRVAFNPLKEGSTYKGYMLLDSIVRDLSPSVQMHHIPKEMRGV